MVSYLQKNVLLSSLLVFGLLTVFLLFNGSYLGFAIPVLVIFAYLVFYRLDLLLYLIAFCVPLSLNFENLPFGFGLILPTEPILITIILVVGIRLFWIEKSVFLHPISMLIILNLGWLLLTTATSTLPLVSLKFLIARCWFVFTFYFLALKLFQKKFSFKIYTLLYVSSFLIVILYVIYNHWLTGFANSAVYSMTQPFYKDHTSYGAILVMLLPFLFFQFSTTKIHFDKLLFALVLVVFCLATLLSYTRAAWLSLVLTIGIYLIIKLKINLKIVFASIFSIVILLLGFNHQIKSVLLKNSQDASGNFTEHINSIYNISTDASNVERINRWSSAIEMFKEKPVFGFGPGTYAFKYAPYQLAKYKTIISTNFGDVGNAHSEYLGPLAETGLVGAALFLSLVIAVIIKGLKNNLNTRLNKEQKWLNLSALLGLISYLIHGFLNNYLDTDKASALFWVFIAYIAFVDFSNKNKNENDIITY